ncbi:MAG: J domain-containing protein [Elusimicrobiota bacterium]|jgi:curved DNA-binding protein|nr:J domain-containing protein [Elusimicrobiota bacterium]
MADYKDYYKILGIAKNAGEADIKKAFKTAARKYHPDMHPESQKAAMTEKFKDINEAYEVLSDKQKRAVYDQVGSGGYQNYARSGGASSSTGRGGYAQSGAQHAYGYGGAEGFNFSGTGGFEAGDFSDFFQSIFGGMGGANPFGARSRRNAGNPFAGGNYREQSLDGEANLTLALREAYKGGLVNLTLPDGRNTQVKLPARISNGAKIKLKGLGNKARGASGDLYVSVKIAPDARFRLEGDDIYAPVDIAPWTAALGGAAAVDMPDGGGVNIKVPAGSRSGAKLKLSGKGLGKSGNMYVQLMINNPKMLTKAQKDLFAKLAEE